MLFGKTYGPYMTGRNVSPVNAAFYINVFLDRDFDDETNERIEIARRGGFSYTWMPSSHIPVVSCTEVYADYCKKMTHKYD